MENPKPFGLTKPERIHSRTAVETLFSDKKNSIAVYPLRAVWAIRTKMPAEPLPHARILISVPKKRFRHAVDRNRLKRQIREAYRLNKHILLGRLSDTNQYIDLAFISIADKPADSHHVHKSVLKSLMRIADSL